MESDCQQLLDCSDDCQQKLEQNDYQQLLESNNCDQAIEAKENGVKSEVVSVLQLEVSDEPQIEQLIEQIKAQADNMQQLEINQTELGDLQQKEVAADDDGKEKKKKFKLPQIEIPDRVKIFLLALLKQFSVFALAYFVYYWDFSAIWIAIFVVLLTLREAKRLQNAKKHALKKAAAMIDEKDAIRYRIDDLPSWVLFPDVDRAEWLNKILKQTWPSVNKYIEKLMRTTVQKKIQKKFDNFQFEEIDMGRICPRVDGVKVYDKNTTKNEIVIDFDVYYDGDCDINFSIYGTKGSINDFQLSADLRLVLKPLIPKLPLVGGLQVFFLNNPDIDFTVEGIVNIPGLKYFIKRRISKLVSKELVFPNKIPIKLSKSLDAAELKSIEPEGVLRVHVVEAKDLEKKDCNVLGIGKSDPYAVVRVGAQDYKTKIVGGNVDPKWDFWCEFCILDRVVQHLDIEVLDHDLKGDDFLGSIEIDLDDLLDNGKTDKWFTLEKVKHGKVHLRFTWLSLSTDYSDLEAAKVEKNLLQVKNMSTALLAIYIDSAKNIPQRKPHKKPHPYLALTIGSVTKETKPKKHTTQANWEQGFIFLVANPEADNLYLTVIDKHSDDVLDQQVYSIRNLSDKPDLEVSKESCRLNNGTVVVMSLQLRILKSDDEHECSDSSDSDDSLQRRGSTRSNKSGCVQEVDEQISDCLLQQSALHCSDEGLKQRCPSLTGSAGEHGLGKIQLTFKYSEPRQKLIVTVHKLANLPLKDPSDIPDPYVKLLLLPGGPNKKQKTKVINDNCNPVYNEMFEYLVSKSELCSQKLIITVKTKIKFSLHNKFIGQVVVNLDDMDLVQAITSWFDLCPEEDE